MHLEFLESRAFRFGFRILGAGIGDFGMNSEVGDRFRDFEVAFRDFGAEF